MRPIPPSFVDEPASPPLLLASFLGVLGALFALGCGTARIDAVVSDEALAQAGAPAEAPADVSCHEPAEGRHTLRAEGGCLSRGSATTVFGMPAFAVQLSPDCVSPLAQWELTPTVAGAFTLRNVETKLLLDVRAGSDLPGAAVILYDANGLDNQRFWLRPRSGDARELSPRNAPTLCVQARADRVETWPCEPATAAQDFVLQRDSCR